MDEIPRIRMSLLALICVAMFAGLLARLWYLQGISQERFETASREQRVRVVHEQAPRGRVLDRNGVILVDNEITTVIGATRQDIQALEPEDRQAMYTRLADKLTAFDGIETKVASIAEIIDDVRYSPLQFIPLIENAPKELELFFAEQADAFPGIKVKRKTVRKYNYGPTASNLLGYVGPLNDKEYEKVLAAEQAEIAAGNVDKVKHYEPDDEIGKLGVEASMEKYLRGTPGKRVVEVSRTGQLIRELSYDEPKTGDDVWLTIDINAQAWAEWVLLQHQYDVRGKRDKEGRPFRAPQASAVVTSPQTGEIVVAASLPLFDPRPLVHGISTPIWSELNDPENGYPLNNYALQGEYAPGSTFKLITAYAALENGLLDAPNPIGYPDETGKYTLEGCADVKCSFKNAGNAVGGWVEMSRSLTVSNDVFYYWLGDRFWVHRDQYTETGIQNAARQFGLGERTGIEFRDRSGVIPTPERRRQQHAEDPKAFPNPGWFTGDNLNLAIGQGEVLVTPLQLTNAYATFANGGTRFQPQLISKLTRPADPRQPPGPNNLGSEITIFKPIPQEKLAFTGDHRSRMMGGLIGAVNDSDGTAYDTFQKMPLDGTWGGKTGTAEAGSKSKPKADTSAFVLFGPIGDTPAETAWTAGAIIPEAGFGSDVAAPTVLRILRPLVSGSLPKALTAEEQDAGARPPGLPSLDISDRKAD